MKNFSGRIMNFRSTTKSAPDQNLPDFIDRFLKYYGAVVEKKEEGFEVLLPEKLCTILGTTEHIFIPTESEFVPGKYSGFSPDNVLFINYGSEPLEKIVNAVCSQVPLLVCQLQFNYLKSGGFEALIKKYPDSDRADNAQFWIGECYMGIKKYEKAILAYQEVIKKYPKGNKLPSAMLRQAIAFLEIKDKTSTRLLLKKIINKYPDSSEAQIAKKKLEALK